MLYIIATPLGNLEDISARALKTLREVNMILAEDTRRTKKLLFHFQISKPLFSYQHHSSDAAKEKILENLQNSKSIALVTDAGTPGISDPGNELIDFLLKKNPEISIIPIPGPSAVATALSISGFKANQFQFLGFLPKKGKTKVYKQILESKMTTVFFESPFRIHKTMADLAKLAPDRKAVICREMTKIFEEFKRGTLAELTEKINVAQKGEITVVIEAPNK